MSVEDTGHSQSGGAERGLDAPPGKTEEDLRFGAAEGQAQDLDAK
jgi:hypothetical protein